MVGSNVLCTGISYGEHTKHSFWYDSRLFMSENNPSNLVTVHSAMYKCPTMNMDLIFTQSAVTREQLNRRTQPVQRSS